jgi:hypothetical protein
MLKISAIVLLTLLSMLNVVGAWRHGAVQRSFSLQRLQSRAADPTAFLVVVWVWESLSAAGLVGLGVVLVSVVFSIGPSVPASFWAVSWSQWPLGVAAVALLYLVVAKFQAVFGQTRMTPNISFKADALTRAA